MSVPQKRSARRMLAPERWAPQCTHIRVTRHFHEDIVCDHCKQPNQQGWVWRCTGDGDGRIPWDECVMDEDYKQAIIAICERNGWELPGTGKSYDERVFNAEDNIPDIICLKPWMIKAVAAGEYTPEQISTLIRQRIHVKQKIQVAEEVRDKKEEEKWLKQSLASNRRIQRTIHGLDGEGKLAEGLPRLVPMESFASRLENARKENMCKYRACVSCKPNLKERSWVSLNGIVNDCDGDDKRYPDDIDSRPLNLPELLIGLGDRTQPSSGGDSSSDTSSFSYGSMEEEHIEQASRMSLILHRHSNPLCNNIRKVFRDFVTPMPRSHSADGKNTGTSTDATECSLDTDSSDEDRRSALAVERPQSRLDHSWDQDPQPGWRYLPEGTKRFGLVHSLGQESFKHMSTNNIADVLASTSAQHAGDIPMVDDEKDIDVEEAPGTGVAVTEEAASFRMADLITQV